MNLAVNATKNMKATCLMLGLNKKMSFFSRLFSSNSDTNKAFDIVLLATWLACK